MVSKYTSFWHKQASLAVGFFAAAPLVVSTAIAPAQAHDDTEYYIGLDGLQVLTSGTYAGLDNPNYNRLTFLTAHRGANPASNHFHSIGTYSYLGSVDSPSINKTSANNRIPETYTGIPPLKLLPGTGIYAGRLISYDTHEEYSNLNIQSITSLAGATEEDDQYLFNSSRGRWQSSLAGATIGLQLLEISRGLNIANEAGVNILNTPGDIYTLGSGDDFSFTPTFWTQKTATPGTYSATFKLVDLSSNNYLESGTFSFDFRVEKVPEPSTTIALGFAGLLALSISHLKKRTVKSLN
ncbi:all3515 family Zur-repressed PEP-CTERM protein [Nostoc sp. UHCC 0870]|uniref:all3515 family Zur-repressed PEP-CTERM protein n=1 Tax=Nostoc sp. UHCC 0870 TaxID=2914041 RepID=UPI001EDF80A7|nr:all3515 family Zur-repressed PEP-CTERM protein [Nostoc sp. UHCC 0870]UKO97676.1 all3515 family Zur-repressed PEP-CTERM protein [Nostoc sp. UHCC 0870]